MANITPRKNKNGVITSYTIRVYHGYDGAGKRLKPYTMSWKPAPGMTAKQIEKELNRQAVQFEEQCRAGYALDNRQTFAEYAEYVLKCKADSGTKRRTIERYTALLGRINAGIGHIKLADLRPQHLNSFYSQLRQAGIRQNASTATPIVDLKAFLKEKGITKIQLSEVSGVSLTTLSTVFKMKSISGANADKISKALKTPTKKLFKVEQDNRPLSEKTVREHHRLISLILSQAEKEMIVQYNAAEKVINKPKAESSTEVNYLELSDLERIRECLTKEPFKWQVLAHLLIVTGCRRGEIAGLKWNAIDFDKGTLHIYNNLLYSEIIGVYQDTPKTATSDRYIRLPNETIELLREYKAYWDNFRRDCGSEWHSFVNIKNSKGVEQSERADFLFVQDSGSNVGYPMHPDSITDYFKKFSKKYDLPHINPHAFRHTLASVLCQSGVDIVTISKWLGHKSVTTTMNIYEHILENGREQVVNCVSDIILGKGKAADKQA